MKNYKIRVKGKVQGVYYRKSTKEAADNFGLTGWVKNVPDGSVLIMAQGEEQLLQKLIEWCHIGSLNAIVEAVEVEEVENIIDHFSAFEILR